MADHFRTRLRKGAAATVVAAAAIATLAASQAPGAATNAHTGGTTGSAAAGDSLSGDDTATGTGSYYTDLPPLINPTGPTQDRRAADPATAPVGRAQAGIPATVLDAYEKAAAELQRSKPGCNLPWQLLAAIGKVESGQARGGRVDPNGTTYTKILGPLLDGNGFANIKDTDNGAYDGDSTYDRAVGPMQFIPSTWAWAARDGNGDGIKDPNNIYDAALATAHYLCRFDRDLSRQADLNKAILSYNGSQDYLNTVLSWYAYYRKGTHTVPDGTGTQPTHRSDHSAGTEPNPRPGHHPPSPGTHGSRDTPPTHTPDPSSPRTPEPKPSTAAVDHLADGGTGALSAMTNDTFKNKIVVKAVTKAGKAVPKVRIRFTISSGTDATFTGGRTAVTILTSTSGKATAPSLVAGKKTGPFTVRATVTGSTLTGLGYTATVTQRQADTLTRTSDSQPACTPGGEFTEQIEVKATYKGAAADGVAATAALITSADNPAENDKGPYFKDADGKTIRTLEGLTTGTDGLLKLPKLYADDTTGTFFLNITTTGGATLTVELTVAAAAPPASLS